MTFHEDLKAEKKDIMNYGLEIREKRSTKGWPKKSFIVCKLQ
jgi:hypothetical protein